jgi:hypothetical protein
LYNCLRYQRGNQNPYIEDEQTTQWSKEKGQKDKQRSTKHTHTHKTKDRVTQASLRKFYGRHHDLVECYGISVSQMTTDMLHLS